MRRPDPRQPARAGAWGGGGSRSVMVGRNSSSGPWEARGRVGRRSSEGYPAVEYPGQRQLRRPGGRAHGAARAEVRWPRGWRGGGAPRAQHTRVGATTASSSSHPSASSTTTRWWCEEGLDKGLVATVAGSSQIRVDLVEKRTTTPDLVKAELGEDEQATTSCAGSGVGCGLLLLDKLQLRGGRPRERRLLLQG